MKARTLEGPYTVKAGGLTLEVTNVQLDPPDPSVGIIGWSIVSADVTDLMGNEVDVDLDEIDEQLWAEIGDFEGDDE